MYKKECTSYERKDNKGEENCKLIRIGGIYMKLYMNGYQYKNAYGYTGMKIVLCPFFW